MTDKALAIEIEEEFANFRAKIPHLSGEAASFLFQKWRAGTIASLDRYKEFKSGEILRQNPQAHSLYCWFDQWEWVQVLPQSILVLPYERILSEENLRKWKEKYPLLSGEAIEALEERFSVESLDPRLIEIVELNAGDVLYKYSTNLADLVELFGRSTLVGESIVTWRWTT